MANSEYGWWESIKIGGSRQKEKQRNARRDPQMAFMWEISFKSIFPDDGGERIKMYAQSTGIPAIITEPIKRRYAGVEYTYAGRNNSPKVLRVTVWDDQRLHAYHYFQKWKFMMNEPETGKSVRPDKYMREITIKLLDGSGHEYDEDNWWSSPLSDPRDQAITSEFIFDMCFPTEISEASLSYETSALTTFDVIFSFNKRSSKGKG